jgi:hypothetical protein
MALTLQRQSGVAPKFLDLLTTDLDTRDNYYFVICGRFYMGNQWGRVLLHNTLITESQKIKCKRIIEPNGEIARDQWTIVLKFNAKNWQVFKKKTNEREVCFECLFKKSGRDPTFAPIFQLPSIGKKTEYIIRESDFKADAMIGFHRGGIKINYKKDGSTIMLIRLEERGFMPLYHYVVVDK